MLLCIDLVISKIARWVNDIGKGEMLTENEFDIGSMP